MALPLSSISSLISFMVCKSVDHLTLEGGLVLLFPLYRRETTVG